MDDITRDQFIQCVKESADQIRDLMDAYDMDDITRDQFIQAMTEILRDWHAAHTEARMLKPDECDD
jgi:lipoate-protein ligase A